MTFHFWQNKFYVEPNNNFSKTYLFLIFIVLIKLVIKQSLEVLEENTDFVETKRNFYTNSTICSKRLIAIFLALQIISNGIEDIFFLSSTVDQCSMVIKILKKKI